MAGWRKKSRRAVSASELAGMGACERQVYFEQQCGRKTTSEQRAAIARGNRAHARFFKQAARANPAVRTSQDKPWCFIASATFGPSAVETQTLRLFRDQVLRPCRWGRGAIKFYYRVSPRICRWLIGKQWAVYATRSALRPVVMLVRLILAVRGVGALR